MTIRARMLRAVSAGASTTTFGPTVVADDWQVTQTGFSATPSAATPVGNISDNWIAYGMLWTLNVPKDATISSATLAIRVTTGNGDVVVHAGRAITDDASAPGDASAAATQIDRCTTGNWGSDIFSGSGVSTGDVEIDVKTIIQAITTRSGWASGQDIALFLAGEVVSDGMGGCTGQGDDNFSLATLQHTTSAYRPTLEVVYSE